MIKRQMRRALIMHIHPINRGDELLLRALEASIRDRFGKCEILYTALDRRSVLDRPALQQPLQLLMRIDGRLSTTDLTWAARFVARLALAYLPIVRSVRSKAWSRLLLPPAWRRIYDAARESDAVLMMAGGYLIAEAESDWYWLSHLLTLRIVEMAGSDVVSAPMSVGPFNPSWDGFVDNLLSLPFRFFLRDEYSVQFVESKHGAVKFERVPDLGFANPRVPRASSSYLGAIGISVRWYHFGGSGNGVHLRGEFETALVDTLVRFKARFPSIKIVFVPQSHDGRPSDAEYAQTLVDSYGIAAEVIHERLPFLQLMEIYGDLRLLIGVRLHACIGALTQGTPVVAIGYEPKTMGAMMDMNLLDNTLDIRNLSADALLAVVFRAMETADQLSDSILKQVDDVKIRSIEFLRYLSL